MTVNNLFLKQKITLSCAKKKSEENEGIGLNNVEKRLNLIYSENHTMEYGELDGIFRLEMKNDVS